MTEEFAHELLKEQTQVLEDEIQNCRQQIKGREDEIATWKKRLVATMDKLESVMHARAKLGVN